jgi:DNA-binding CsgD family transcriptional regulator
MTNGPATGDIAGLIARLTPAERRCLELVARGLTSKAIGRELGLAPNTVDAYVKSASQKLGVNKRILAAGLVVGNQSPLPKLVYENSDIPTGGKITDTEASAGQGDGPGDLSQDRPARPESSDSGRGPAWLEPHHPIAQFFGGENRLPLAQRAAWVVALAIGFGIGFGGLVSGLLQLSRLYSSP